jgi:hypothetical protein
VAGSAPSGSAPGGALRAGVWTVDLPGGRLRVTLDGQTSFLSGPAVIVAEGELDRGWLAGTAVTASVLAREGDPPDPPLIPRPPRRRAAGRAR